MLANFCRSSRSVPLFPRAREKRKKKFASAAARNFRRNELGFIYRSNYWRDVREAGRRDIYRVSGNRRRANARRWRQKLLCNYTQSRNVTFKINQVQTPRTIAINTFGIRYPKQVDVTWIKKFFDRLLSLILIFINAIRYFEANIDFVSWQEKSTIKNKRSERERW